MKCLVLGMKKYTKIVYAKTKVDKIYLEARTRAIKFESRIKYQLNAILKEYRKEIIKREQIDYGCNGQRKRAVEKVGLNVKMCGEMAENNKDFWRQLKEAVRDIEGQKVYNKFSVGFKEIWFYRVQRYLKRGIGNKTNNKIQM